MIIAKTDLPDVCLIEPELLEDDRGFFARTFCKDEFQRAELESEFIQNSLSFNHTRGTVRGLHLQLPPVQEVKLVRCLKGAIFDVVVDLRLKSPTFAHWQVFHLDEENRKTLYVPKGCAHGFQTLSDNCEIFYQISAPYSPEHTVGVIYNDPDLKIEWPLPVTLISGRDRSLPTLKDFLNANS